ncbi:MULTISPECIES: hypothetical protein [Pseudoalteromonas]|uniref:hypothetical protein n=1 Tax=Pseudoalteromonas TaxID=53246 RepID=UPI0003B657DF|nr:MULTISPECIES: hypothetical protein [Pseudoalteromonas]MCF2862815.1 hypothetical protein [Pseudoalteromonas sp. CNAT2-18]MCG7558733.1 hypothetical protein [Pseudoalteromonas sp. CNAT2-18.1]MCG7567189.1 hypothetical protein [Pseudoalteromonas sp. CnMc7-15]TMO89289.1 hypothetical protein CWC12_06595 [Pseudoalteromonas ruthenica]TMO94677.1 hypothetical protein CWC13_00490 [Pseudoalteromonas ruthenica]|tara:strand:- start:100607 stop:101158 length:552 start_codon:yes stop_codon:yes gene_type:complete
MYLEKSLAIFMGAFVVWGFLMALFFNLMLVGFKAKNDLKLLWVSFVMAVSYFISDHFHNFFTSADTYMTWVMYDLVTLALISVIFAFKSPKASPGVVYVVIGLSFNTSLFLAMHYDIVIQGNVTPWWLWSLYSIGMNLSDLTMIVVLIVDRDILGIINVSRSLKRLFKSKVRGISRFCFSPSY